jgi:hypothetical protein
MAGTATPIYPQTIKNWVQQVLPADTTTLKTLVTGGTNGSVVEMINISSTDTVARDMIFYMTVGGVDYKLFTISIPINSGNTNAIAAVAPLNNTTLFSALPFNNSGNKFIYVANGSELKVAVGVAVSATRAIQIVAHGGDY